MRFVRERFPALGLLATGLVCPCHALVGLAALLTGSALLTPAEQDGIHAAYVPAAVLIGALLLKRTSAPRSTSPRGGEPR